VLSEVPIIPTALTSPETLEKMDLMPKRAPLELLDKLKSEGNQDFSIDDTERRINRPKDNEEQKTVVPPN
jgi:hypothetical protein